MSNDRSFSRQTMGLNDISNSVGWPESCGHPYPLQYTSLIHLHRLCIFEVNVAILMQGFIFVDGILSLPAFKLSKLPIVLRNFV